MRRYQVKAAVQVGKYELIVIPVPYMHKGFLMKCLMQIKYMKNMLSILKEQHGLIKIIPECSER